MVASVSSSYSPTSAANGSSAGLYAELARYKKEHSACVNCESATTQAGKLNIQSLETKIGQLQARIDATQTVQPVAKAAESNSVDNRGHRIDLYA